MCVFCQWVHIWFLLQAWQLKLSLKFCRRRVTQTFVSLNLLSEPFCVPSLLIQNNRFKNCRDGNAAVNTKAETLYYQADQLQLLQSASHFWRGACRATALGSVYGLSCHWSYGVILMQKHKPWEDACSPVWPFVGLQLDLLTNQTNQRVKSRLPIALFRPHFNVCCGQSDHKSPVRSLTRFWGGMEEDVFDHLPLVVWTHDQSWVTFMTACSVTESLLKHSVCYSH